MRFILELWRAHHGKNNNMLSSIALKYLGCKLQYRDFYFYVLRMYSLKQNVMFTCSQVIHVLVLARCYSVEIVNPKKLLFCYALLFLEIDFICGCFYYNLLSHKLFIHFIGLINNLCPNSQCKLRVNNANKLRPIHVSQYWKRVAVT